MLEWLKERLEEKFPKKFKTRLAASTFNPTGLYDVQYAYYRIIPIWKDICYWDYIMGWECKKEGENYINREFLSIDDVRAHHQAHDKRRRDYYRRESKNRKEYYKHSGKIL